MSFLICPDIHGKPNWYDFLKREGAAHEATLVPGDVLDFHNSGHSDEAKMLDFISLAMDMEALKQNFVFTSGNHDLDDMPFWDPDPASEKHQHFALLNRDGAWMSTFASSPFKYSTCYGNTKIFDDAVVLAIQWLPWGWDDELKEQQISKEVSRAAASAKQLKKPLILIYHEDPKCKWFMEDLVLNFQPDYFICGHEHSTPLMSGSPIRQLGNTVVINTGQDLDADTPCHAILDLETNTLLWQYTFDGKRKESQFKLQPLQRT